MTTPIHFCVCSFKQLSDKSKHTIINKLGICNVIEYCVFDSNTLDAISCLENILPDIASFRDNVQKYTYCYIEPEAIEFFYKLYKLNEVKRQMEHTRFYDCVLFVNDEGLLKDLTIPSFLETLTIYSNITYEEFRCNVDNNLFFCDTVTFNIICDFFKFLKKTDIRFFQNNSNQASMNRFFYNSIKMHNITILDGCAK